MTGFDTSGQMKPQHW